MSGRQAQPVTIEVDASRRVSALLSAPADAFACCVLAHGAGAGMEHPFMAAMAEALAARAIATLRYQFPYMERGSRRPDAPKAAQDTVRAAVIRAAGLLPGLPLIAGGKSYGGRMTSRAQADAPLPGVRGLAFLGFPLHAPRKPSVERADHLFSLRIPTLFLQGTRDDFADLGLLQPLVARLGSQATLELVQAADHSFHVPAKSGRKDAEVRGELAEALAEWIRSRC